MSWPDHRRSMSRGLWLAVFVILVLAGAMGGKWALPGTVALGQTIPRPTATATPTATSPALPTPTWTPRPTWTRVPTSPPELPTATLLAVLASPTPTQSRVPTLTPAGLPTPTASPTLPWATPSASPTPIAEPAALLLVVEVPHPIAGPADRVTFILQVANVGYEAAEGVRVSVTWPDDLLVQSVDCATCAVSQMPGRLTLAIGRLAPGGQVIAPVVAVVAEDAWPGQLLRTDWTLTAEGMPAQQVEAMVELPWAELPATG
nr:hypothetical protein [Chloroflexota bacterium]